MSKSEFMYLFNFAIVGVAGVVFLAVVGLTYAGNISFVYCNYFNKVQAVHFKCVIII